MAADPDRIKSFSVYRGGKKIGVAETADVELTGNDEEHLSDDGWTASDGQPTTSLTVNTITPVDGKTSDLTDAIVNKDFLRMQLNVVDGEAWSCVMKCMSAKYTTDMKTGSLKGTFSFKGGTPNKA
jgi:hypothetical protein